MNMHYKVEISNVSTSGLKVLKNSETVALLTRLQEGEISARKKIIEGNLRLVLSIIQRFSGRGEMVDDLFQIGTIGLMKAIDNFDIAQGVRFSTYAVPMILGEIRRHLRDNSSIRVSRSLKDAAYKALACKEKLQAELGREPTVEEIAQKLQLAREEVVFALEAIVEPVSLFEPVYSDSGDAVCVVDQIRDSKNTDERWLESLSISEAMKKLSGREQQILSLRYFDGRTQMEVAAEIGISQAQVSRLEKSALNYIKKSMQ